MPKETKKENKHFFKEFKAELKKVIWPSPKQLVNNTVAVISIVLITAAIVFVLDFAFEKMNTYGVNKLKEIVDTTSKDSEEKEENDENVTSENNEDENTNNSEEVSE